MGKKKKQILKDKIELEKTKPIKKTPEDMALDLIGKKMEQQK